MARYSIANRTSNVTTANATLEIIAPAAGTRVVEITITMGAATASIFGIGKAAAIGITPTSPVTLLSEDTGRPATLTKTALAWATGPTIPAAFFERANLPATVGAKVTLSFPYGITLATGESLVLWNIGTTGVADVRVVVEE